LLNQLSKARHILRKANEPWLSYGLAPHADAKPERGRLRARVLFSAARLKTQSDTQWHKMTQNNTHWNDGNCPREAE
jgi:hypothetical protein